MKRFLMGFMACFAMGCSGVMAATAITDIGPGSESSSSNGEYGWYFSISTDITITHIGVWDADGDGLEQSSTRVRIWTSASSEDTYVDVTLGAGTNLPLVDGFRWMDIDDVVLLADDGPFTISQNNLFGVGQTFWQASNNTPTVTSPITLIDSRGAFNPGQFPTTGSQFYSAYIGPNFQFVPEPASMTLLGASSLLLLRRRS